MRLIVSQSWLFILTAIWFVPIRPAHSAETQLPRIRTNCTTNSQRLLAPIPLRLPPTVAIPQPEQVAQSRKIRALIEAKQWKQALQEFQKGSSWVQNETMRSLFAGLVQANETARASRFVIEQFPPQSKQRAQGLGVIAAELTNRNQLKDAIALLKNLPPSSEYLSDAVIPVVEALTATNQIQKIPQVMTLFPVTKEKWTVWTDVANAVLFEPAQAKEVAGIMEGEYLRSLTLKNIATKWLSENRRDGVKAWTIANEIEDCSIRIEVFLNAFEQLNASNLNVSNTQKAQALDQMEALIAVLRDPNLNYQSDLISHQISLAGLNIRSGRKAEGLKLLERVQQGLKQFDSDIYRAETLIKLATQYQSIGDNRTAIQLLDTAVIAVRDAYNPKPRSNDQFSLPPLVPSPFWREEKLEKIAERYRSLNQIRKAEAIGRTLPQRAKITFPNQINRRYYPIPGIKPLPNQVPSLKVPR